MPAILAAPPKAAFFNASGAPLVGGKLYTYAAGTSTPATTWADSAQVTQNTNPIVLDSRGECSLFLDPSVGYKFELRSAADALIYTQDNVLAQTALGTGVVQPANMANAGFEFGTRNKLINGDFRVDQRGVGNAGVTVANASRYTVDGWLATALGASSSILVQRFLTGSGSVRSPCWLQVTNNTANAAPGSTDRVLIEQRVEGLSVADLLFGTANARAISISFDVFASIAGTYCVAVRNGAEQESYIATFTINAANTWETKTITVPGRITGTWPIDSTNALSLVFALGAGSTYTSANVNQWISRSGTPVQVRASGAVAWQATVGAVFALGAVQLERGTVATPLEFRPYGQELALCQRYYEAGLINYYGVSVGVGATAATQFVPFAVTKRTTPGAIALSGGTNVNISADGSRAVYQYGWSYAVVASVGSGSAFETAGRLWIASAEM